MARPRDPRRDKAKKIWLESNKEMKLVDIAHQLGVTSSTIRKWKSQDQWDDETKESVPKSKRSAPKRSGAPQGNKNAVGNQGGAPKGNKNAAGNSGGSAPLGNKNAVTTGEYETIMWDYLDDEEKELFSHIPTDPLFQTNLTIKELSIRQRRMMRRIKKIEEGLTEKQRRVLQELRKVKDVITTHDEKTGQTRAVPVQREQLMTVEIEGTEFRAIDDILNIEEALTRITDKLLKATKQKHDIEKEIGERELRLEKLRVDIEKSKAEIAKIRGDDDGEYEDDGFLEAIDAKVADIWSDEND